MKGEDPRIDPAPLSEVPRLLRAGAEEFNARRYWHAHEAWEAAWHSLRKHAPERAAYVKGMILVTAALENAVRGKESGFKRQFAEGLHHLLASPEASPLRNGRAWVDALVPMYVDACRRVDWSTWRDSTWTPPPVELS